VADKPNVKLPPPVIYAGAFAIGYGIDRWLPWAAFAAPWRWWLAGLLAAPAAAVALWALLTFHRADTAIEPWAAARRLVTHGPYAYTRNPMYVSLTLLTGAVAVALDLPWALLMLPLAVLVTDRHVIAREELHLRHVFGAAYRDYCARTRRWLGRKAG
jgi:protein-S-isoprenylcysteine O-methyltransferase Ste14